MRWNVRSRLLQSRLQRLPSTGMWFQQLLQSRLQRLPSTGMWFQQLLQSRLQRLPSPWMWFQQLLQSRLSVSPLLSAVAAVPAPASPLYRDVVSAAAPAVQSQTPELVAAAEEHASHLGYTATNTGVPENHSSGSFTIRPDSKQRKNRTPMCRRGTAKSYVHRQHPS